MLFKVLGKDGAALNGGKGKWSLPKQRKDGSWTPGKWMPAIENVEACSRGYHLVAAPSVGEWWRSDARILAVAEVRGERQFHGAKVAVAEARLVEIVTPEWEWLPLYPAFRAHLMSAWRFDNPYPAEWPTWADLSGAYLGDWERGPDGFARRKDA